MSLHATVALNRFRLGAGPGGWQPLLRTRATGCWRNSPLSRLCPRVGMAFAMATEVWATTSAGGPAIKG